MVRAAAGGIRRVKKRTSIPNPGRARFRYAGGLAAAKARRAERLRSHTKAMHRRLGR